MFPFETMYFQRIFEATEAVGFSLPHVADHRSVVLLSGLVFEDRHPLSDETGLHSNVYLEQRTGELYTQTLTGQRFRFDWITMFTHSNLLGSASTFLRMLVVLSTTVFCSLVLTAQDTFMNDWHQVDVEGLFSFRLPKDFTKSESAVSETPVGEYSKGSIKLEFKWRPATTLTFEKRRQEWMNDYEESTSRIRGKRANIRTFWRTTNGKREYHAELNVGNWERGEIELYMTVVGGDQSARRLALEIFKSVSFPNPIPERPE